MGKIELELPGFLFPFVIKICCEQFPEDMLP
jgi:hypothetical protein